MMAWLVCVLALLLDAVLGEPRRWHPLAGFGYLASRLEGRWNRSDPHGPSVNPWRMGRWGKGALATLLLVVPPSLLILFLAQVIDGPAWLALEVLGLYLALGLRSLNDHARAVVRPLLAGEREQAREAVGMMVSRDTQVMTERDVSRAATESVLENGADAVVASLFWFLVAGLPGVILHRLVNTLDAMWGYRNARFQAFGCFVARLDDAMAYLPARLTALAYAFSGQTRLALACWYGQAGQWSSPNAGPVMAAGAGALGLSLGGPAPYAGQWLARPALGPSGGWESLALDAPLRAIHLVYRAVAWILFLTLMVTAAWHWNTAGG